MPRKTGSYLFDLQQYKLTNLVIIILFL